jgi:DNA-binding protein HU-beta
VQHLETSGFVLIRGPPQGAPLQVQARPARIGRNPATGSSIKIAATKKIAFRAPPRNLMETI